jgi:hypothetical protein
MLHPSAAGSRDGFELKIIDQNNSGASQLTGDRGDKLTGVKRTQRRDRSAVQGVKGLVHVHVKESGPPSPGMGTRRCA